MPPIRFEVGVAEIPDSTVTELRKILEGMRDRRNVRLHLVGHADTQPLSPALAAVFGDNEGLSRERAGEVAELLQRTLLLPAEGISYEWAGDQKPVASNASEAGRAQNRRVEVEVWYDEVEQGTALDEVLVEQEFRQIKVCRMETVCRLRYIDGNERRTRVQNVVAPLRFDAEAVEVTPAYIEQIRQAVGNLSDRHNVLVKFVGYTDDAPLERAQRAHLRRPCRPLARAIAPRRAGRAGGAESADVVHRQRRPRHDAPARVQRDGARACAESPRGGRVLVRRSAAGAARRAAALPGARQRAGHARL